MIYQTNQRDTGQAYPLTSPVMPWGNSPTDLHEAVDQGNLAEVLNCLEDGADVCRPTWFGLTALHLCARRYAQERRQFHSGSESNAICKALLAAGADPLARASDGTMPAAWAEGFLPPVLRTLMLEMAEAEVWPEDDRPAADLPLLFDEQGLPSKRPPRWKARHGRKRPVARSA